MPVPQNPVSKTNPPDSDFAHLRSLVRRVVARAMREPALGDKRRHIAAGQIDEIVTHYGRFEDGDHSKIFDNADLGYTRITVERPLRLRYQMTTEDKARFLDACPHLLDDVRAIDKALGREPKMDWNKVWEEISALLHKQKSTFHLWRRGYIMLS